MLWVELGGVVTVGTLSLVRTEWFPDASVWSGYGIGYGFVPLALPIAGLLWLRAGLSQRLERVLVWRRVPRWTPGRLRPHDAGAGHGCATARSRPRRSRGGRRQGLVTDELIDYHLAVADGGVGLTTVAYLAVAPEGRTHREQILVGPATRPGLARLADAIHETGAAIAGQVGHAGPVANGRSNGVHALSASRMPSPLSMQMVRPATEKDLTRITRAYVDTARILVERRLRRARAAHGAQLPDLLVPRARPQPAQGRVRRLAGEPGPAGPPGRPRRARGGRRRRRRSRPRSASATASRAGSAPRRASRSRGCSRPTATSTRSSSPAAAR